MTQPTQAQIEAAAKAMAHVEWPHAQPDELDGLIKNYLKLAAAAAEVCPQCGQPAGSNGTFQCRCTGITAAAAVEPLERRPFAFRFGVAGRFPTVVRCPVCNGTGQRAAIERAL